MGKRRLHLIDEEELSMVSGGMKLHIVAAHVETAAGFPGPAAFTIQGLPHNIVTGAQTAAQQPAPVTAANALQAPNLTATLNALLQRQHEQAQTAALFRALQNAFTGQGSNAGKVPASYRNDGRDNDRDSRGGSRGSRGGSRGSRGGSRDSSHRDTDRSHRTSAAERSSGERTNRGAEPHPTTSVEETHGWAPPNRGVDPHPTSVVEETHGWAPPNTPTWGANTRNLEAGPFGVGPGPGGTNVTGPTGRTTTTTTNNNAWQVAPLGEEKPLPLSDPRMQAFTNEQLAKGVGTWDGQEQMHLPNQANAANAYLSNLKLDPNVYSASSPLHNELARQGVNLTDPRTNPDGGLTPTAQALWQGEQIAANHQGGAVENWDLPQPHVNAAPSTGGSRDNYGAPGRGIDATAPRPGTIPMSAGSEFRGNPGDPNGAVGGSTEPDYTADPAVEKMYRSDNSTSEAGAVSGTVASADQNSGTSSASVEPDASTSNVASGESNDASSDVA